MNEIKTLYNGSFYSLVGLLHNYIIYGKPSIIIDSHCAPK